MQPTDKIKEKLTIIDVVSSYIRLEKSGAQYKARCPFHNEKTPSFYVSPSRASFHCFGCNKGGDIFKFIEEIEHIPFREALKLLADRAGISLAAQSKEKMDAQNNLLSILSAAKYHYAKNFSESSEAQVYLKERGMINTSIADYSVGFAKAEWRDLFVALKMQGYNEDDMVLAGVIIRTEDGKYYDRFRGRIMFPINNISGATVGFTGRILPRLDDGKSGKYVNTPETSLYHKSEILFNYDKAKSIMRDTATVILVEGQMDVVMSNQAGVQNVLAVSGTAFTDQHVHMIKRLCDKVVIAFDNDKAGEAARLRAISMCIAGDLEVYTLPSTEGKDAADIIKEDPAIWLNLVNSKVLIWDYLSSAAMQIPDLRERIKFIKDNIVGPLSYIPAGIYRSEVVKYVSKQLSMSEDDIQKELAAAGTINKPILTNTQKNEIKAVAHSSDAKKEITLIALANVLSKSIKSDFEALVESKVKYINDQILLKSEEIKKKDPSVVPSAQPPLVIMPSERVDELYKVFFDTLDYPEELLSREIMKIESEAGDYQSRYTEGLRTALRDAVSKYIAIQMDALPSADVSAQPEILKTITDLKRIVDSK